MRTTMLMLVLAAVPMGCGSKHADRLVDVKSAAPRAAAVDPKLPPGHPPVDSAAPDSDDPGSDSLVVSGKVAETMNAGSYTYIRVTTKKGDVWTAIPQAALHVGDPVTVNGQLLMEHFESKTLKRTFDRIIFGTLAGSSPPSDEQPATATDMSVA